MGDLSGLLFHISVVSLSTGQALIESDSVGFDLPAKCYASLNRKVRSNGSTYVLFIPTDLGWSSQRNLKLYPNDLLKFGFSLPTKQECFLS